MIIHDFNVYGAGTSPTETHPKLVVDPDAVLSRAVALQCFQPVAWRHSEIVKALYDFQLA